MIVCTVTVQIKIHSTILTFVMDLQLDGIHQAISQEKIVLNVMLILSRKVTRQQIVQVKKKKSKLLWVMQQRQGPYCVSPQFYIEETCYY